MRILFVAMPHSIHTARWIGQVVDQGWDLHLVPSMNEPLHKELKGKIKVHGKPNRLMQNARHKFIRLLNRWPYSRGSGHARRLVERLQDGMIGYSLMHTVQTTKPDIVHSMEIQQAGYQTLNVKTFMGSAFPTWIMSNWGSDVYLFHKIAAHKDKVKRVLEVCDYYASECMRDVTLAKELGLRGQPLPVIPCGGGFDLERWRQICQPEPTSNRRVILLKGYQHWAGRALAGLRAIELCADVILDRGYSVLIPLASPDVVTAAEVVSHDTGIPIVIAPHGDYEDAMRRFSIARVHIGLSISDGISQSLLESMVMGAFPIQSSTACANEWIDDGRSGFLVPPEDPHIIAEALRRALIDDAFVDQAVAINHETVNRRLSYAHVKAQTIDLYNSVLAAQPTQR